MPSVNAGIALVVHVVLAFPSSLVQTNDEVVATIYIEVRIFFGACRFTELAVDGCLDVVEVLVGYGKFAVSIGKTFIQCPVVVALSSGHFVPLGSIFTILYRNVGLQHRCLKVPNLIERGGHRLVVALYRANRVHVTCT